MPLSESQLAVEYQKLNDFLKSSLNHKKDKSLPDIILNSLEVKINDVKTKLDSSLKEYIIEFVYVDEKGRLIKKSNSDENISIIHQNSLLGINNIQQIQPLVIVKEKLDSSTGHLYQTKKIENNKIILEYLGKKELPSLLLTTQSEFNTLNNEEYEEELDDINVNIVKQSENIMKLSFAEDGTCYLFIDDKNKTIVPTYVNDAMKFKNFVAKKCPRNGTLNIEIDKNGKILFAYIINNETHKRQDIEIDEKLIDIIERVISTSFSLQNNSSSSKKEAQTDNSFPTKKVNDSEPISPSVDQQAAKSIMPTPTL